MDYEVEEKKTGRFKEGKKKEEVKSSSVGRKEEKSPVRAVVQSKEALNQSKL
jgi:hypothetical protein